MFEKVLVTTDFSQYSTRMLECMGEIPGVEEIVLLHVIDTSGPIALERHGWSYDSQIEESKKLMADQIKRLASRGSKVRPMMKVIAGEMSSPDGVDLWKLKPRPDVEMIAAVSIGDAVQKVAEVEAVPLIVMGAQGKGLVKGALLGSVSTDVLRHGKANLLIIRHKLLDGEKGTGFEKSCPSLFSRVVCTTDFSEAAGEAVSFVRGLKGVDEVLLVNVASKGDGLGEGIAKLNALRDELAGAGQKASVHALEGKAAEEIVKIAQKLEASMIVMSYQGKGWLKQMRVGSVTFDVAQKANCPVMVVKSGTRGSLPG